MIRHPDPCPHCPHKWHGLPCKSSNLNSCLCPTSFKDQSQPAGVNGGGTPPKAGHDGAQPSA